MSMLTLNNDCLASVTAVPDLFLEQYMPAANGEFVKVYLYLLKLVKDQVDRADDRAGAGREDEYPVPHTDRF